MRSLLLQMITETFRKMSKNIALRTSFENHFFATLETFRDSQLKRLSPDDRQKIVLVHQRCSLNVRCFNSQLTTATENAFMKSNREAKKEAREKRDDTPMDTSPEAKVTEVLDRRLKQLGILGKKSRSKSQNHRSVTPTVGPDVVHLVALIIPHLVALIIPQSLGRALPETRPVALQERTTRKRKQLDSIPNFRDDLTQKTMYPPSQRVREEEAEESNNCF